MKFNSPYAHLFAIISNNNFIYEPSEIESFLKDRPFDVHVLPWYTETFEVNYLDRNSMQSIADSLNKQIKDIEPCDPWVKSVFNVEGIAEGIVFSWISLGSVNPEDLIAFKMPSLIPSFLNFSMFLFLLFFIS